MFDKPLINLEDMYDCIYKNADPTGPLTITCGKLPFSCPGPRPGTILGLGYCAPSIGSYETGLLRKQFVRCLYFDEVNDPTVLTAQDFLNFLERSMNESDMWDVFLKTTLFDWDGRGIARISLSTPGTILPSDKYNVFHIDAKWIDLNKSIVDTSNY